jgi:hypothetical protein
VLLVAVCLVNGRVLALWDLTNSYTVPASQRANIDR